MEIFKLRPRILIEHGITLLLWSGWLYCLISVGRDFLTGASQNWIHSVRIHFLWISPLAGLVCFALMMLALRWVRERPRWINSTPKAAAKLVGWSVQEEVDAKDAKRLDVHFANDSLLCSIKPKKRAAKIALMSLAVLLTFLFDSGPALAGPVSTSPLFQSTESIRLSISAPFQRLKKANEGGDWTEDDQGEVKEWFRGTLVDRNAPHRIYAIDIRGRGKSSALVSEGDFPKLRVAIEETEKRTQSVFKGARQFRLNTHVSTDPRSTHTKMGRLNDERSPYREALAYEIADAIGLATPAIRRASILYSDLDLNKTFERKALVIETDKNMEERYQAKVLSPLEFVKEKKTRIDVTESALIHLFQVLIGNDDFILRVDQESPQPNYPDWDYSNVIVLERRDGSRFVAPYDFDLSTFVAGEERLQKGFFAQPEFGFESDALGQFAMMVASLRARHSESSVRKAVQHMHSKRAAIERVISIGKVDSVGRQVASEHAHRFFTWIDVMLEMQVVQTPHVPIYRDAQGQEPLLQPMPISLGAGKLRSGTPIKVLQRCGAFLKVAIIDYRHDLAVGQESIGYIPADSNIGHWVAPQYIGWVDERDQPK